MLILPNVGGQLTNFQKALKKKSIHEAKKVVRLARALFDCARNFTSAHPYHPVAAQSGSNFRVQHGQDVYRVWREMCMPRSYHSEYTRSRPISEVKQSWARLVLR